MALADVSPQELQAFSDALHSERARKNTRQADCWACEASHSETLTLMLVRLYEAAAERDRLVAVLHEAVPDRFERAKLMAKYGRQQIEGQLELPLEWPDRATR